VGFSWGFRGVFVGFSQGFSLFFRVLCFCFVMFRMLSLRVRMYITGSCTVTSLPVVRIKKNINNYNNNNNNKQIYKVTTVSICLNKEN
jgi:hypothetical protein